MVIGEVPEAAVTQFAKAVSFKNKKWLLSKKF
jgi:negative regulator of sigma E activity